MEIGRDTDREDHLLLVTSSVVAKVMSGMSRGKLIVGGVVTYITAVGCTYTYLKTRPPPPSTVCNGCGCTTPFSVRSAEQYDRIAMTYDTKINMDEFVMGVKLLRWHLVSKAGGEVLEVASGTGRNLGYYNYGGGGGGG